MFATKSLAALKAEAESGELKRALSALDLTMLGVGAIVGAGIFVLTGQAAAQYAGPAIAISFVGAAIACGFAGLCYAEFASMIPVAGSAYTYAYATLGEIIAWIIGWDLILEYSLGAATVSVGWSGYVTSFLADFGLHLPPELTHAPGTAVALANGVTGHAIFNLPAAIIVLAVSALLIVGIRESAGVNAAIVALKVTVIILFIVFGAAYVNTKLWQPFVPPNEGAFGKYGWSGVLRGAGVIFFAYIGFDAVSTAAQEAKNPQRDMPIGILVSLAVTTVLYILVALVLTGLVPFKSLNVADPIAVGVNATPFHWLRPVVKLGAILGLSSVILVMLLGQPRIFYTMAKDGLLPSVFAKVHPKYKTPYVTTAVTGTVVAIAGGLFPIDVLAELVSIGTLLAFVLVCLGVLVLRYKSPELERPFKVPGVPVVPALGALACLYLMSGLPLETWARLIIWLIIGMFIYFFYGRARAGKLRAAERALHGEETSA